MTQQRSPKRYWKDSLRQVQVELDEAATVARNQHWARVYRQAQADLAAPEAVVWLPDEIAEVIRSTQGQPHLASAPLQANRSRLPALLLALCLFLPVLVSYVLAYRQIVTPSR